MFLKEMDIFGTHQLRSTCAEKHRRMFTDEHRLCILILQGEIDPFACFPIPF